MTKILVIPDQHAHPDFDNDRADLLGRFLLDLKPEYLVNIGDAADMASLSGYDKGKRSFTGRSYAKDIDSHLDFQERMWEPIKKSKKRLPYSVVLEGNHEHRVERALDLAPELEGTISFDDFKFHDYYDHIVRYEGATPGVTCIESIYFSHYFTSGVMGRPIAGEHPAYSILTKQFVSCVQGHTHTVDYCVRTTAHGSKVHGLVAGVFQDYRSQWAGTSNDLWWRGLVVLNNVDGRGGFEPQFVTIDALKKEYSA